MSKFTKFAAFFLIVGGMLFLAGAGAPGAGATDESSSPSPSPSEIVAEVIQESPRDGSCLVDEAALEDLRKQRESWASRMKDLGARESELKAREAALNEEFRKFEALRSDLGKDDASRQQENEVRVAKLVETLETMSPKAASALIVGLDEALAVATMARIATPKLAKIMNIMEPKRSARLTELMAGVVRAKEAAGKRSGAVSDDADETTLILKKDPKKGGEKL